MIHYELRCGSGHHFDGWFRNSATFDQQARSGLLDCPVCASADVSRAIMSPRLGKAASPDPADALAATPPASPHQATAPEPAPPPTTSPGAVLPLPDQLRAALQRLRAEVEQRCDYVGPRFAETARAIHAGRTAPRPIYGEASPEQAEALAEDGIEVSCVPWVARADG